MTITAGSTHSPEAGARTSAVTHHAPAVPPGGRPGPRPRGGPRPGRPSEDSAAQRLKRLVSRGWATLLSRLRLLRAAILLLTAALAALLLAAGLSAAGTWDTVLDRDAPRTTSAAALNLALNDMDAHAANLLLSNGEAGAGRLEVPYDKATEGYAASRHTISTALRTLAVSAQNDPEAGRTVEALTQAHFEGAARDGQDLLSGLLPATGGALAAVTLLCVLGLRPRLAEFR